MAVVGVVFQPVAGRLYSARAGGGGAFDDGDGETPARSRRRRWATLAEIRIGVTRLNATGRLGKCLAATGLDRRAVPLGASVKHIALARGDLDAGAQPQPRRAGVGHLRARGHDARGRRPVTDGDGRPFRYNQPDTARRRGSVASNGAIHAALLACCARTSPPTRCDAGAAGPIVTIDGVDGSGKSTLRARAGGGLEQARLAGVAVLRRRFSPPGRLGARRSRDEVDIYYDDYYALDELERCLQAFLAGAPRVTIPVFDSRTETLAGERDASSSAARASRWSRACSRCACRAAAAGLVIYVELDAAEARRRLIARDLARGRARAVIEHRLNTRYVPAQERYVAAYHPAARADVVIDSATPQRLPGDAPQPDAGAGRSSRAVLDRLLLPLRDQITAFVI